MQVPEPECGPLPLLKTPSILQSLSSRAPQPHYPSGEDRDSATFPEMCFTSSGKHTELLPVNSCTKCCLQVYASECTSGSKWAVMG